MHKIFMGLIALLVAMMVVSPVFAMPNPYANGEGQQNANGVMVGGIGNSQVVVNEHADYNGETEQNAKSIVNGNGNKVNTVNNNLNVNGDVTNGATSVSNVQTMTLNIPKSTAYYGLDTGAVTDRQIISLYLGQVFVANLDGDNLQIEGDKYTISAKSSLPVLAYIANMNDVNKAKFDNNVAPTYDTFLERYELGNLDTIYVSKYRSPQQQFDITIPEAGKYVLVLDTRVSTALDGKQTPISADSVDIIYAISRTENGTPTKFVRNFIGTTDMFPIDENGSAITS
jgi:hypothetical protein